MNESILIIEDNTDIRENIAELLTLEGYCVEVTESGEGALCYLEKKIPNLIICDILMAGMDGYQVLSALRKNKLTKKIPFIFSSAMGEQSDKLKAMKSGVKNYLVKPFEYAELLNCVKRCIQFA